ncbi:MAG: hypothetical protein WCT85_04185 [Parachlamydiales bacterium]|jgi:hypothetical protein
MGNIKVDTIEEIDAVERSKRVQAAYTPQIQNLDTDYSTSFALNKINQSSLDTAQEKISKFDPAQMLSSSNPILPSITNAEDRAVTETADSRKVQEAKAQTSKKADESKALGLEIAKAIERNEVILQGMVNILVKNIKVQNTAIVQLSEEDQKKLQQLLEQLSKKENADMCKHLLNIATSATAITIGSILISPQAITALSATAAGTALYSSVSSIWSYLLISSGISNLLINEVLPKVGGFEKIASFFASDSSQKQKIADNIQITASLTNAVMGVVSSIATSPLIGALLEWSQGLKVVNTALELASGATSISKDFYEKQYFDLQAEQTLTEGNLNLGQHNLDKSYLELHSLTDMQQNHHKLCYNIFQTLQKINSNNSRSAGTPNLQMALAETAVESIRALNKASSSKTFEIYEEMKRSSEQNENTAKAQKSKAIPHGWSALVTFVSTAAVAALSNNGQADIANMLSSVSKVFPEGATIWSSIKEGNVTLYSQATRISETAAQRLAQAMNSTESLIVRIEENAGRLLQKES